MEQINDIDKNTSVIYITSACNSNCIMCPMSEHSRQLAKTPSSEEIQMQLDQIPDCVEHIDITGGEPFLQYEKTIHVMNTINNRWKNASVQVLTNGRALSLSFIQDAIKECITSQYRFAIPIHGHNALIHDRITQANGSFDETLKGLEFLSKTKANIEVRFVVHNYNISDAVSTCQMLVDSGLRINTVSFIAMEMTGCAAMRRNELWVDYADIYPKIEEGIMILLSNGIDADLYNFPLCSLPHRAWPMAKKSISEWKVRYYDECNECREKSACGGLFYSTYLLKLYSPKPF